jgi:hypothetical protein
MAIRRNGMAEPDDSIGEWEYQQALEDYNEYLMGRVEALLEDDNYRNFWREDEQTE